jgi:hypothetical protein
MELLNSKNNRFFVLMLIFFSISCNNESKKEGYKLDLEMSVFGKYPELSIITELKNNSENDYCILGGLLHSVDVYKYYGDLKWKDYTETFYSDNHKLPKYPPNQYTDDNYYSLPEESSKYTDYVKFYHHIWNRIFEKYYEVDSVEYPRLLNYSVFAWSKFIKAGETWRDTINTTVYLSKRPDDTLKFVYSINDKINLVNNDIISIDSLFKTWQIDMNISIPEEFNGYKLIYKNINLESEIIVSPP